MANCSAVAGSRRMAGFIDLKELGELLQRAISLQPHPMELSKAGVSKLVIDTLDQFSIDFIQL